jgi:hypothetical protein
MGAATPRGEPIQSTAGFHVLPVGPNRERAPAIPVRAATELGGVFSAEFMHTRGQTQRNSVSYCK